MKFIAITLILASSSLLAATTPEVPIVSLDDGEKGRETMVTMSAWENVITHVVQALATGTLTSFEKTRIPFKTKSIVVGLGVNAEVGITGIWTMGAQARIRLVFCPLGQAPVIP